MESSYLKYFPAYCGQFPMLAPVSRGVLPLKLEKGKKERSLREESTDSLPQGFSYHEGIRSFLQWDLELSRKTVSASPQSKKLPKVWEPYETKKRQIFFLLLSCFPEKKT